ncbi:SET domain-containing protein [Abortiporus biennis]
MSTTKFSLLPPASNTTYLCSKTPHIVCSDKRYEGAPHFLYLPHGKADLVYVDYLPSVENVAAWPIWSSHCRTASSSTATESQPPCFRIKEIPGKGLGLVARRRISAGELIISERPIYAARKSLCCAADQTYENGIFYRAALGNLSEHARTSLLGLENSYPSQYDLVPGILNTNCLEIRITPEPDPTTSFVGCFPTLSRVNHDCTPSAYYYFDNSTFHGQLRAIRDTMEGEEITITYAEPYAVRKDRQEFLQRTRFFICECRACMLTPELQCLSDRRRENVRNLINRIENEQFPPKISLEELSDVLRKAGEEGLIVDYARILMLGSQVLTLYNDLAIAMEWTQRARRMFVKIQGENSYTVKKIDDAIRVQSLLAVAPTPLKI